MIQTIKDKIYFFIAWLVFYDTNKRVFAVRYPQTNDITEWMSWANARNNKKVFGGKIEVIRNNKRKFPNGLLHQVWYKHPRVVALELFLTVGIGLIAYFFGFEAALKVLVGIGRIILGF